MKPCQLLQLKINLRWPQSEGAKEATEAKIGEVEDNEEIEEEEEVRVNRHQPLPDQGDPDIHQTPPNSAVIATIDMATRLFSALHPLPAHGCPECQLGHEILTSLRREEEEEMTKRKKLITRQCFPA